MRDIIKIWICIVGITLMGSTQGVIMPQLVMKFPSIYFILFITAIEFGLIFLFIILAYHKFQFPIIGRKNTLTLVLSGIFNSISSIFLIYTVHPERTPILIQTIISGLIILPSVVFTKIILQKKNTYNLKLIIPSLFGLFLSLGISSIPLFNHWDFHSVFWILGYSTGIALISLYSIYQEKYFRETRSVGASSVSNKIIAISYVRITQMIFLSVFFWIEYIPIINYAGDPNEAIFESFKIFFEFGLDFILLQAFILAFLILYCLSIYLNSISTNYNMISMATTNPCIALFYTIFQNLNPGIKFPIYIVLPSLFFSIVSILLWMKGENKEIYQPVSINVEREEKSEKEEKDIEKDETSSLLS